MKRVRYVGSQETLFPRPQSSRRELRMDHLVKHPIKLPYFLIVYFSLKPMIHPSFAVVKSLA